MKQINSNIEQEKLRNFFIKSGVKMIGPETIFFQKIQRLEKTLLLIHMLSLEKKLKLAIM